MPNLALFSSNRTFRLVTRSDFDGLVCAALLKELVYDHFGGAASFPRVSAEMMEAVDRADARSSTASATDWPRNGLAPASQPRRSTVIASAYPLRS